MDSQLLAQAKTPFTISIKKSLRFGWEAFLQDPWMYILFTLIGICINLIIYQIPVISSFVMVIIGLPLQLGIAIYYYKKNEQGQASYKDFFDGFKRTKSLLKFFLIVITGTIIALIPLFITVVLVEVNSDIAAGINIGTAETEYALITKIIIALYSPVILFLCTSIIFAPYFIYFYKKESWEAIQLSFHFVKPRWFAFFIFYVFIFLIGFLSMLPLFLGLLIATPVTSLATFHLFFNSTNLAFQKSNPSQHESILEMA